MTPKERKAFEYVRDEMHGEPDQFYLGYKQGYADAMNWKAQNHLEHLPVAMRMPKVGDKVVCIEDESLGVVAYLTAGGSPEIKFDDGSYGTYLLREFSELFRYATNVDADDTSLERVDEADENVHEPEQESVAMADYMAIVEKYAFLKASQLKPLTPEQIEKCFAESDGTFVSAARAIEAAHNIKE